MQAIVLAWQGQCSRDSHIMKLMRTLFMFAPHHHFTITMQHLPGNTNLLADAISCKQFTKFFLLFHRHSDSPRRPLACSTSSNLTPATLASPLLCPVHKTVIPHRDQALHSFLQDTTCPPARHQLLAAQRPTLPLHCISKEWPQQPYAYTCLLLVHVPGRMGLQTPANTIHCSHW